MKDKIGSFFSSPLGNLVFYFIFSFLSLFTLLPALGDYPSAFSCFAFFGSGFMFSAALDALISVFLFLIKCKSTDKGPDKNKDV